ncbi:MAG TPA: DNA polymerase I [Acidimicrobiales bacterium]
MEDGPLLLLDGMSLAFRAFFALPPEMATSDGVVTNAVYGFFSMLTLLVKEQRPSGLLVAFDLPGGTFRDDLVEEYKGGRDATPPELEPQFGMIIDLLGALAVPVVTKEGFEADDVLATIATRARDEKRDVIVVTGDRDCFQLVEDPHVRVLYNKRGVSDYALYDEAGIIERTGIEPARYPLLAALRGDPSDNLPGVPGVGEKTAAKLFTQFQTLDELFAGLASLTPKLRENLAANEALARTNADVMVLVRDVELDVVPEDLHVGGWNRARAETAFEAIEMRTLWKRLEALLDEGLLGQGADEAAPSATAVPEPRLEAFAPADDALSLVARVADRGDKVIVDAVLDDDRIVQLVVADARERAAATVAGEGRDADELLATLTAVGHLAGHDVKDLWRAALMRGVDLGIPDDDTAIGAYLLDSGSGRYRLHEVLADVTGDPAPWLSSGAPATLLDTPGLDDLTMRERAAAIALILESFDPQLDDAASRALYAEMELPLLRVLARMEVRGIRVDAEVLRHIAEELRAEAASLEVAIQQLAGHEFKVTSTQQLQAVLYEELGLTRGRKTKTGFSTDATTLETLRGEHEIIDLLLRFREIDKLRSTYGENLAQEVREDGRIHARFRQTVARTGRLSSEQPNLHNIPTRTEDGRRFRQAFLPTEGWSLLVADYDQIELRVIAHLSGDEGLCAAFASDQDVHRFIAGVVFGIPPDEVTHDQRERAKAVSYGLAYGMEAYGLSRRFGISVGEAKEFMDQYFDAFPGMRSYMDETVAKARVDGFTTTAFGRIRHLPELIEGSGAARAAAERQAMNAGTQGTAADIFKLALVRLDQMLVERGLEARIVLQVHDEVIVEAPPEERDAVAAATLEALTSVVELRVPLKVSLGWGDSWAKAKG